MRKFVLLGLALVALTAGVALDPTTVFAFTDCASGGSVAQTLTAGEYLMTVTDESVWLCLAASGSTCASGGTKMPSGFGMVFTVGAGGVSASCRSSNSTGDIQFTRKSN